MMEIRNIHFCHADARQPVLNGISMEAASGRLTVILGPNGSGKTTLFKCIAGLWKPGKGDIFFAQKSILHYSHEQRARLMAVVPQDHVPPFPYSVFDVVLMGRAAHVGMFSPPGINDYAAAEQAIAAVGIGHLRDKIYTRISGGERQMVLLARALAQEAPVMLLDEPTSHLDFRNQVLILRRVRELIRQRQMAAIMTLHDPNTAMLFADSVVLLGGGMAMAQGDAAEVLSEKNLDAVYGIKVAIGNVQGARLVTPKYIDEPEGHS